MASLSDIPLVGGYLQDAWNGASGKNAQPVQTKTPTTRPNPNTTVYDPRTNTITDQASGVQYALPPGYVYDPASGQIKTPDGRLESPSQVALENNNYAQTQIHAPAAADQVLQAKQREQQFLDMLNTYAAQQAQGFAGEQGLAGSYQNTITDPNAPSVARTQLLEALNASQAQQMAAAGGVSGDNAALARQNAMRNMGGLATQESNEATRLRAEEVARAQSGLSTTLNNMANQGQAGENTTGKLGEDYGMGAMKTQEDLQLGAAKAGAEDAANKQKAYGALFKAIGSI